MELTRDLEGPIGDSADALRSNFEFSPEDIRYFLPMVNWERLASMYLPGRSGAECEARWLNIEDPMINHNPWTILEEKKLLHIVQNTGIYNWIDIAVSLGTHRTPFQCLVRYQRSLNPCILKRDWTKDEDSQLRAAVETFGDSWQLVASTIEGRTGTQCSNRWRKSLMARKMGRWSVDEDKRLKVAVILFGGKSWNKIAQFISGRTQTQCRERWVNCLDPGLNLKAWTEEEDVKLKEAIAMFGYCWSKVASFVPPRTDNQCRRRWKVLFPDEVPLRRAAWKMQKAVLISNFVDRESERPSVGPNDFCQIPAICYNVEHVNNDGSRKKKLRRKPKSKTQVDLAISNVSIPVRSKKCEAKVGNSEEYATTDNQPVRFRKCKSKIENFKENAIAGNCPVRSRKCKANAENSMENAAAGEQQVRSRKYKAKVETFKENATLGDWLEVVRNKIRSKKRNKGSGKEHEEMDHHTCSKGNQEFAQHAECLLRLDDVSQINSATDTCSDVASRGALQKTSLRCKPKGKSLQGKVTKDGLKESCLPKTILGKRKRNGSVHMTSHNGSTRRSRDHEPVESSMLIVGNSGCNFESAFDDVRQTGAAVSNGQDKGCSDVHHPNFSSNDLVMSRLEKNSTQGGQPRQSKRVRKKISYKLLVEGGGYGVR